MSLLFYFGRSDSFLNTYLLKPLGMEQTGYLISKWNPELLANGYTKNIIDHGSSIARYQEDGNISWHLKGNGGINSIQEDMYRWYKGLSSYPILNKPLFENIQHHMLRSFQKLLAMGIDRGLLSQIRIPKELHITDLAVRFHILLFGYL